MTIHRGFGLLVAGLFLLVGIWGLFGWFRNRDPGSGFWRLLAAAQVSIGIQAIIGIVVFLTTSTQQRPHFLHYVYGAFPVVALVFAHRFSRKLVGLEWVAFAFAGLFVFGLQLRGLMTGTF